MSISIRSALILAVLLTLALAAALAGGAHLVHAAAMTYSSQPHMTYS